MKFLFALFAATVATAAGLTADQLGTRWNMDDEPDITYDSSSNTFTIDYLGASDYAAEYQEEFYDVNCKDDGSGFPEVVVRQYFEDPDNAGQKPKMTLNTDTERPELKFKIDTQAAANDENIYEVVGQNPNACMGQYYNLTASISVTVDADVVVDYYGQNWFDYGFFLVRRTDNMWMDFTDEWAMGILDDATSTYSATKTITGLCRDTDYDFHFYSTNAEGTNDLPKVQVTYDSSGTPDVLFTKTEDEMNAGPIYYEEGYGWIGFTELISLPENPQNPATNLEGQDGKGMMKFCVRGGIGYNENDALDALLADAETDLATALANGYQEVNFIESLITIFYNLSAGFDVDSFNVDPKERVETTATKEAYGLEAWLCVSGTNPDTDYDSEDWDDFVSYARVAPKAISDNFKAGADTPEYFNQGALITVCVAPVKEAFADGIRMDGITDFEWKRDDFDAVFAATSTLPEDAITQPAIVGGEASANLLTSYIDTDCEDGKHFCRFSSILFADFYITTGVVSGSGNAKLVFGSPGSRRLGESQSISRQLQADEGGESPFDLLVPVDITDTGPAGLKTAAGVSFAAGTFTMAVALVGAALLA